MEKQSWKHKNAFVQNPQINSTIRSTSNQTLSLISETPLKQKFIVLTKPNIPGYINHKITTSPIETLGKKIHPLRLPTLSASSSGPIKPITHKFPVLSTDSNLPITTSIGSAANVYKQPFPIVAYQSLNSMPKKPQTLTSSAQLISDPVLKRSPTSPSQSPVKKTPAVVNKSHVKVTKRSSTSTPQANNERPSNKEKILVSKKQQSKIDAKRKDKPPTSNGVNGEVTNGDGQQKKQMDNKVNGKNKVKNTEKLQKLLKETYNNKHVCIMCKKVFDQKKDALLKHFPTCDLFLPLTDPKSDTYIYRKDGYDYIACEYIECQYETPFKENYRKHIIEEHTKNYLHNCYVCSKGFVDKYEKITHNCSKRVRSKNVALGVSNEKKNETNAAEANEKTTKNAVVEKEKDDNDKSKTSESRAVKETSCQANENSVEMQKETQISNEKDGDNDHSKETVKESSSDESVKPLQIDEEEKEVTQNDQETTKEQDEEQKNIEIETESKNDKEINEPSPEHDEMDQEEMMSKEVKKEKIENNLKIDDTSTEMEVEPVENDEVCETDGKEDSNQVETDYAKTSDETEDFSKLNLQQLDQKGSRSFFCKYPGCTYVGRLQISFVKHFVFKHQQEKPFQCEECGDQFFTSETRDNHVEEHRYTQSEEEYLGKTSSKSSNSKQSVQPHPSNAFPVPQRIGGYYSCSVCTYKTRVAKRYKMHSWRHVLNAPFKCQRCKLSYILKREYLFHARICRFYIKNDKTNLKEPHSSVTSTSDISSEINVEDIPVTLRNNAPKEDETHSDTTIDSSDNEMDIMSFKWSNGWVDDEFLRVYGSVESQLGKEALQIAESDIDLSSNEDIYVAKSKKKQRTKRKYPFS